MPSAPQPRERQITIIAQDPSVRVDGKILRSRIRIPAETLKPGPVGYRVEVIDYDATHDTFYLPQPPPPVKSEDADPFENYSDEELETDPVFHRFNAYALVMRTLARFEFALGRRIGWGFSGHQLKVAPHAFSDANAFYSEKDHALLLGYFPGRKGMVFTSLSHDVVVHETTHALVDGLRERYTEPSSPDQAAFHEGFADVVALLSVFALRGIVEMMIDASDALRDRRQIDVKRLTPEALRDSILFGLAEQVGQEIGASRGQALRRSLELLPSPAYLDQEEFLEPHRRGEILVAAMLTAFIRIWTGRLRALVEERVRVDRARAVEEGSDIADTLLTSAIRALDYAPPVDITFPDYLSALVTADREIRSSDSRYELRSSILESFAAYGIRPASAERDGYWPAAPEDLNYGRTHFEGMQRDPEEVFHFLWENRSTLGLDNEAFTRVTSVRPCTRVGPDGFVLRETICEYLQILEPFAKELAGLEVESPKGISPEQKLRLFGGGTLVFDEYGRLKFHVCNPLSSARQSERIKYLWKYGFFRRGAASRLLFSGLHRRRAAGVSETSREEEW
ncbi:MAG TPA: hypothetical protein VLE54_02830 [Thermoanaerobaculia bacterium]|nr:hypothetical protein [Thermoanaerobaculia bacterium]